MSIGLPVYNGERYLDRALESLLAQTFHDFELIISDNCSTDATESICLAYAARDDRIRYIRQAENRGAIPNFNFVFTKATGEYFKWAAYDDLCEPNYLAACVEVLDTHPDVVLCHTESDRIDENDRSWLGVVTPENRELVGEVDGQLKWLGHPRRDHDSSHASRRFAGVLLGTNWNVDSYGLIRCDALRRTRMIQPYYGAEKVLLGELALQGRYYHVRQQLFAQRIHAEASSNISSAQLQAAFVVGTSHNSFLPTRFAILLGHLGAIWHARLPLGQRIKCHVAVLAYLLQPDKWTRIIQSLVGGRGVGGDGVEVMVEDSKKMHETTA